MRVLGALVFLVFLQFIGNEAKSATQLAIEAISNPLCMTDNNTLNYLHDLTYSRLDELFTTELKSLIHRGPEDNHVWGLFLNLLPEKNSLKSLSLLSNKKSHLQQQMPGMINHKALSTSEASRRIDALASVGLGVTKNLAAKLSAAKSHEEADNNLVLLQALVKAPNEFCPFKQNIFCDQNSRFAKLDGSCNNLQQPWFGKAETPYKRYFPTAYDNGIDEGRKRSKTGNLLPNPRVISRTLFNDNFQSEVFYSHILAIFGQFLAHDITSASVSSDGSGNVIDCPCNSPNPACMSIQMPSNENVMRMSCMKMTRSSAAFPNFDCNLGHREQLNLLTSFIDATQVYGPSEDRSRQLRTFQGGQLKASQGVNQRPYLVQATDRSCRDTDAARQCFAAGEGRTNENMGLTSMQLLFFREHNRLASELQRINPQWNDERLFQEARKILIALKQHIIYNEWLPTVIGLNNAALFDLTPLPSATYFQGYDQNVNPQLANEFAVAAFRFGHTLVRNNFGRFDGNNQQVSTPVNLLDIIFRPVEAHNAAAGGLDSIFIGLINEPAQKFDTSVVDTLQNRLFEFRLSDNSVVAIDLAATNINRGRDHGIPGYNEIRERCGFSRANSFNDFANLISADKINQIASIYEHPDDVDFYVGGLSETPASGAVIGPTFACVIANQFKDLKRGDRFYYENGPSNTAFTLPQLAEIKKITMSRLACNNFDINFIQPNAFLQPLNEIGNNKKPCNSLPMVNLNLWKE